MPNKSTRPCGVHLTKQVWAVIEQLSLEEERSRSHILERIIRDSSEFQAAVQRLGVVLPRRVYWGGGLREFLNGKEPQGNDNADSANK